MEGNEVERPLRLKTETPPTGQNFAAPQVDYTVELWDPKAFRSFFFSLSETKQNKTLDLNLSYRTGKDADCSF